MSRICFNCMKTTDDGAFCSFCGKKSKTAATHHLTPGTILHGKYTVGYALGEGGFGITYVGLDNSLQMKVAIKEFFPKGIVERNSSVSLEVNCLGAEENATAFNTEKGKVINEARILAKFSKEHGIVNVREYFEENDTAYIVMEFLEGETLEQYIQKNGALTPDQAYNLLYPVMQVLEQLHKENVVHRDISPDNIMFDGNQLKLLDFGAARDVLYSTSKSFSVILKHGYAPEEQYRRKGRQGPWTDVYALCATMYYCITKEIPDTSLDRLHEDELRMPSELGVQITPVQETALMRGLSVLPEDRLQSMTDFIAVWNGQEVPYANTSGDTVWVKNELQNQGKKTTAGGTVYGGAPGYVPVTSGDRNVPGYSVVPEMSQGGQKQKQKKKKNKRAIAVVSVVTALIVLIAGAGLIISQSARKDGSGTSDTSESKSGTQDDNKSPETYSTETTKKTSELIQEYIGKADSYAENGKYEEAYVALDTAEQLYGKNTLITNKRTEIQKREALFDIDGYKQGNDYQGAIQYIKSLSSNIASDSQIVEQKILCTTKYREQALSNAETAFNSDGYQAGVDVLNTALSILPNDSALTSKLEEYKAYQPVHISKLLVTAGDDCSWPDTATDPRKNSYSNPLYMDSHPGMNFGYYSGWIEFYTEKKYSNFSCTIVPEQDFSTEYGHGSIVKIYADDTLIYTSDVVTYKTTGIKVNLNIANAEYLKIIVSRVYKYAYDSSPYVDTLLCDAYVSK